MSDNGPEDIAVVTFCDLSSVQFQKETHQAEQVT
jgi:hypothetical protein